LLRKARAQFRRARRLVFNRIFILGAGAIGSTIGAALSKHYDVTLIGSKTHVETIRSKGLKVTGDIEGALTLKADTMIRGIPEKALIILTTKAQDSTKAVEGIRHMLKKDTVILILQNGIGNEEIVELAAGSSVRVLRGVLKVAAEFIEPGEVKFWSGKLLIGQGDGSQEIVTMLSRSGLDARLSEDIVRDVWNKLVVNCVVNPLTAILGATDGAIIVDSLKTVRNEIVKECLAVAEAEGVCLQPDLTERIDRTVAGYKNLSSMYQDILKRRKTEIDFLNGKIVELGKKHNIPTPANEMLVGLIKYMEDRNGVPERD